MNIITWLSYARKKLSNSLTAKLDSEVLLCFVLKISKKDLFYKNKKKIKIKYLLILNNFLFRRVLGEPIAYIIKKKEFWSLSLFVSSYVLIPRPETEILVEQVLLKVSSTKNSILELGTGSGAISLALASENSQLKIIGTDISLYALLIAKYNADKLNLNNVKFIYSNWFQNIPIKKFHIIVCNPPYLSRKDFKNSCSNISFEPYSALVSGNSGIECIEYIIKNSFQYFVSSGWLYIEHCYKQTKLVHNIFKNNFFINIVSVKDYSNRNRITYGYLNK
ncbi:peptide chain release factor N(5)-glutamine methyltransferase [Buchnera aphidicola]|uniref:Release factor glutamine methyltransferase n=1 Tax=Buchnera aphidicola subsp. Cinara cedri (strain Cc) TaxID=372461 RepID=Q057W0_BUCCC|nr:peptide chain release factor N(5)-glutamine methyltransferase [Buchnera aphidicola]ABJ90589.1 N5-glutamine methyltransferase, release factors activity modulator [Buchnera aphidicola BCc]